MEFNVVLLNIHIYRQEVQPTHSLCNRYIPEFWIIAVRNKFKNWLLRSGEGVNHKVNVYRIMQREINRNKYCYSAATSYDIREHFIGVK